MSDSLVSGTFPLFSLDEAAFSANIEQMMAYMRGHGLEIAPPATGISHVWVNGTAVVGEGKLTGRRPGRLLG